MTRIPHTSCAGTPPTPVESNTRKELFAKTPRTLAFGHGGTAIQGTVRKPHPAPVECTTVYVNIRPLLPGEDPDQELEVPNNGAVKVDGKEAHCRFVHDVRKPDSPCFEQRVVPLIHELWKGKNVTVLAYGPTGSGKTHTIGAVFRASLDELFRLNKDQPCVTISVQFVEVYKGKPQDLLASKAWSDEVSDRRTLFHHESKGVVVSSREEVQAIWNHGSQRRITSATRGNAQSSRSHAIFVVTVEVLGAPLLLGNPLDTGSSMSSGGDTVSIGRLLLVDLAGSETPGKDHAQGKEFQEGTSTNLDLMALNIYIRAKSNGQDKPPGRHTELVRMLRDVIGGNSHVIACACLAPSKAMRKYNISTLEWVQQTQRVKNVVKTNVRARTAGQLKPKEIEDLLAKAEQVDSLIEQLNSALSRNAALEDRCYELEEQLRQQASAAKRYQSRRQTADEQRDEAERAMRTERDELVSERDQLRARVEQLEDEVAALRQELAAAHTQLEASQLMSSKIEAQLCKAMDDLAAIESKFVAQAAAHEDHIAQLQVNWQAKLDAAMSEAAARKQAMEQELRAMADQGWQAKYEAMQHDMQAGLETAQQQWVAEREQLEQQHRVELEVAAQVAEQRRTSALGVATAQHEASLAELRLDLSRVEASKAEAEAASSSLRSQLACAQEAAAAAVSQAAAGQAELMGKAESLARDADTLRGQLHSMQQKLQQEQAHRAQLEAQQGSELRDVQGELVRTRAELAGSQERAVALEAQVVLWQQRWDAAQSEHAQALQAMQAEGATRVAELQVAAEAMELELKVQLEHQGQQAAEQQGAQQAALAASGQELSAAKTLVAELENQVKAWEDKLLAAEASRVAEVGAIEAAQQELQQQMAAQEAELQAQLVAAHDEVEQMRSGAAQAQVQAAEWEACCRSAETQVGELMAGYAAFADARQQSEFSLIVTMASLLKHSERLAEEVDAAHALAEASAQDAAQAWQELAASAFKFSAQLEASQKSGLGDSEAGHADGAEEGVACAVAQLQLGDGMEVVYMEDSEGEDDAGQHDQVKTAGSSKPGTPCGSKGTHQSMLMMDLPTSMPRAKGPSRLASIAPAGPQSQASSAPVQLAVFPLRENKAMDWVDMQGNCYRQSAAGSNVYKRIDEGRSEVEVAREDVKSGRSARVKVGDVGTCVSRGGALRLRCCDAKKHEMSSLKDSETSAVCFLGAGAGAPAGAPLTVFTAESRGHGKPLQMVACDASEASKRMGYKADAALATRMSDGMSILVTPLTLDDFVQIKPAAVEFLSLLKEAPGPARGARASAPAAAPAPAPVAGGPSLAPPTVIRRRPRAATTNSQRSSFDSQGSSGAQLSAGQGLSAHRVDSLLLSSQGSEELNSARMGTHVEGGAAGGSQPVLEDVDMPTPPGYYEGARKIVNREKDAWVTHLSRC